MFTVCSLAVTFAFPVIGYAFVVTASRVESPEPQNTALELFRGRLREAMELRGLNQSGLADLLGVRIATVSNWFTRDRVPMGDVVIRMPDALGVNGHWLLTGEGPKERKPAAPDLTREALQQIRRLVDSVLEDGVVPDLVMGDRGHVELSPEEMAEPGPEEETGS